MRLAFEATLPNLINGINKNISIDVDYEIKENGNDIGIFGKFIVIREVKTENRMTEIKDQIPVEIMITRRNLIKKTKEVSLRLNGFHFEFKDEVTILAGELELGNVEGKQPIMEDFELFLEETTES